MHTSSAPHIASPCTPHRRAPYTYIQHASILVLLPFASPRPTASVNLRLDPSLHGSTNDPDSRQRRTRLHQAYGLGFDYASTARRATDSTEGGRTDGHRSSGRGSEEVKLRCHDPAPLNTIEVLWHITSWMGVRLVGSECKGRHSY
ncbi:hypothetical protein MSAN_01330300 [Mycena sanguinolenta]|uniref:Uncharacterized protein n=1 Tax=Mycena sanguinolenta TaxID=230812 RepID=A0A8H6YAD9_9AGAR|nr:hypothetical protein MSAN_01330300 [Mycena sanguinolenta]